MIKRSRPSYDDLVRDNADLRARLEEAEDTLQAIRTGGVDALAVEGPNGVQIYTIEGADHPYRLFVDSMSEGAVTIDRQGTLVYANQTFADLVGQVLGKTVGTQFLHCIQSSDRPQFEKLLRESHRQNLRLELSLLHRTGESIPVQLSARPTSLLSGDFYCLVVTDLREQRVGEQLHESEGRLRVAVALAELGLIHVDYGADTAILDERAAELFGLTPHVAIPRADVHTRFHPDDRAEIMRLMKQSLDPTGTGSFAMEHRIVRADGSLRWLTVKKQIMFDEGDGVTRPLRAILAVRDVTERRNADAALRESEAHLRELTTGLERRVEERTVELHQSHARLRALANELNVTEQRERTRLAGELHDYLAQLLVVLRMKLRQMAPLTTSGKAETLLKEADHILTQSLDYTRSLVAELAPPALHDFGLTQALAWLASQMQQHGLHVRVTSQQDVLAIPEDQAMLLFQSVRELLFNVLKHAQTKQATVSVSITPNHELHLSVTDEGCGFNLNRIQQTDPKRFGLFSLRERLAAMGGRFELHSTVGQGTHALLVTPYWPAPSEVSSHDGPVANGKPSHSDRERSEEDAERGPGHSPATPHAVPHIRVLLVDDHAMVRQGLCSVLKEYEDVIVAGEACNGAEALDQVEALHPSVVVMDINMPKMNGIQATAVIKARHPDISVIGLSVQAGGLNEEAMKQAGAVTLLTKEAAVDELYSAIQAALAGRRSLGVQ